MQRLVEMTAAQLVALTEEQVLALVNWECAHEGVPMLPVLPNAPEKPDLQPEVTVFKVGGFLFLNNTEAQHVCDALAQCKSQVRTQYMHFSGMYKEYVEPCPDDVTVRTERYYEQGKLQRMQDELSTYARNQKLWEQQKKEYDTVRQQRSSVYDRVYEAVGEAVARDQLLQRVRATFEEYQRMAGGDSAMALGFMRKTNQWDNALLQAALGDAYDVEAGLACRPIEIINTVSEEDPA